MAKATPMSPADDSQFHSDVIHWNDEPVVTTAQLADFYGVAPKMIQNNYLRNTDRFEDGKHMHILSGGSLKAFRDRPSFRGSVEVAPRTKSLTLWTRRGAARHAKMLNSDRAWDVFEALEDSYFAARPETEDFARAQPDPNPEHFSEGASHLYVSQGLAMVRLSLDVWGKEHAAELWRMVGLPVISVDTPPGGAEPAKRSEPQKEPRAGTDEARILEVIRAGGPDGVVRSVITRRFRMIRAVDIDDILDGFESAGLIRRVASASAASRSGVVLIAI